MKDLSIVKGKDDKQCLEAKFVIGNVKDYEKWAAELKNNSFNQSDVIFDPVSHSYHQNGMCGSGGVAKVIKLLISGAIRIFSVYAGGRNLKSKEQIR